MSYNRVTQLQPRIIIGTKQTIKAMKNGVVSEVYIAADADETITSQVKQLAETLNIPCYSVDSKEQLGKACNIEVNASAVAIKRE